MKRFFGVYYLSHFMQQILCLLNMAEMGRFRDRIIQLQAKSGRSGIITNLQAADTSQYRIAPLPFGAPSPRGIACSGHRPD